MRFAVDLLWVRPNKVGGTEFYIRYLLNGFMQLEDNFEAVLILSKDNVATFKKYFADKRFTKIVCNIDSANVQKRILWQNLFLNKLLVQNGIHICFEPVYSKPFLGSKKVNFVTTIHDLQALHYPEYQNKLKVLWLKLIWKNTVKTSSIIVAISEFVRSDIIDKYNVSPKKVLTIYNAIDIDISNVMEFDILNQKFNIEPNNFFYTVASLTPHKNLITLIKTMKLIRDDEINLPKKLLISGIGGRAKGDVITLIRDYGLGENVILTGFVEDKERNALYKYCRAFLFPSVFEGFGVPPIEAMALGALVVTTKKTSLFEVTQGKAVYVENPYDCNEWINILSKIDCKRKEIDMSKYEAKHIASQYLQCLRHVDKR